MPIATALSVPVRSTSWQMYVYLQCCVDACCMVSHWETLFGQSALLARGWTRAASVETRPEKGKPAAPFVCHRPTNHTTATLPAVRACIGSRCHSQVVARISGLRLTGMYMDSWNGVRPTARKSLQIRQLRIYPALKTLEGLKPRVYCY